MLYVRGVTKRRQKVRFAMETMKANWHVHYTRDAVLQLFIKPEIDLR
jgi:hypothetical protein